MAPKPKEERTEEETCTASKKNGDSCKAYPLEGRDKCRVHAGTSADGESHSGNQNSRKHGLHSTPEYLLDDLEGHHKDTYYATHEGLCSRYERLHGHEPDYVAKKRLSRVAVEIVKEDLADEYLKDNHSSNLLVEDETIGYDEESMQPVEVSQANKLLSVLTGLKKETRMTLKDMGLLQDPESKKADAIDDMEFEINIQRVSEDNVDDFGD